MKAAVFHEPGTPLAVEIVPDPAPETGEAVIRVRYCGVCGTDLHATQHHNDTDGGRIMGHEFTGEIVALGADAEGGWREGDRLCSPPFISCGHCLACLQGRHWRCASLRITGGGPVPGAFAEYVRVHLSASVRLPGEVSWKAGALVEPLAVGLHAVRGSARGLSGKNVLVIGAGPIGLAVSLWCRLFGARHVVVSELEPGRAQKALKYGATGTIDPRGRLPEQFLDVAGAEPDVIFECVGIPGMIAHAIDIAPFGAELVIVGFCMDADSFMPATAMVKELSVQFVIGHEKPDFQLVVDMLAAGRLDVEDMITDIYAFDQFSAGFEALRAPTHQCKILLDPTLP
jgi:(R,R)-butanediol dehydrogenase/meso-butanediol dehydrogenase/diacetyl reductase